MKIGVGVDGDKELIRTLHKLARAMPEAAAEALYEEGMRVDADMVPRIPVDTGRLRATHYVSPPKRPDGVLTVEVGVGTDYAVAVHERTEIPHATGEAKFLEKALFATSPGMAQRLADRIRGAAEKVAAGAGGAGSSGKGPRGPTQTGKRGGKYHYSSSGKKVYHRKK